MTEEPTIVDTLYLDAEHFTLTSQARPLEPRTRVVPTGRPFSGLFPRVGPLHPDEEPTT